MTRNRNALNLTDRQTEILGLLADGLSLEAIGERLDLAHGTVKAHAHTIYNTLGVDSRHEAVALVVKRLGIPALSVQIARKFGKE
jgi:ATP/maltotriose-dependent transcriptional regulator MalT